MSKYDDDDDYKYENGIDWDGSDPSDGKKYTRVFICSQTFFITLAVFGAWGFGDIISTVYMGLTVA